jgi:predicted carbohydrate-binding protein with CBM5 and CBM33 domain
MSTKTTVIGTAVVVTLSSSLFSTCMFGHGSLAQPISRIYSAYQEGPENPQSDAVQQMIQMGGTQPLYDWNEVVNFHPGSVEYQRKIDYSLLIRDGHLASADNEKYAGLDQVRDDWPTTSIESGPYEFVWYATTPHDPNVFRAWITTPDWDPSQELNWAQMEELLIGPVSLEGREYRFNTILPERSGKHVIYVIWQRLDPVGEGFYAVSDVDFGEGKGTTECIADLDGNGVVNGADLTQLLGNWGGSGAGDLDDDGIISGSDLTILLGSWGSCGPDCDNDGIPDEDEIAGGSNDCNLDGIPDECQDHLDCNDNGRPDLCEILDGTEEDCNKNLQLDVCELAEEGNDLDGDGVLDDCQLDGLTFEFSASDVWDGGFVGSLTIHNDSGQCISGWELLFDAEFTVNDVWNGIFVNQKGTQVRVVNEEYNGEVCQGESFTIGLQASGLPIEPTNVLVNDNAANPGG